MDYYRDDWNDEDRQVVDLREVYTLENEVLDLRQELQDYKDDALFVLYHLMDFRDTIKGNESAVAAIDEIIKMHGSDVIKQAKLYTRRGETWDYD